MAVIFLAFLVGIIFGSFLNAAIYRLPRKISLSNPSRSFCITCNKQLSWRENIPLISWLLQRGRCLCGKDKIPVRYFIVELIAGISGVATVWTFGVTPTGFVIFFLLMALIAISFIDLDHKIIPDKISFPGMSIGLLLGVLSENSNLFPCAPFEALCPITRGSWDSILGFLFGGGFFWAIGELYYRFTKRDGLGFGDVKLMAMTGGILGLSSVAPTIMLGSFVGALVGITGMLFTGGGRHTEIPFGPWLSLGTVIYIFSNPALLQIF